MFSASQDGLVQWMDFGSSMIVPGLSRRSAAAQEELDDATIAMQESLDVLVGKRRAASAQADNRTATDDTAQQSMPAHA